MFDYDYLKELDEEEKLRKWYSKRGKIKTSKMWNNDSYGSASCRTISINAIFDAYNEYKTCKYCY